MKYLGVMGITSAAYSEMLQKNMHTHTCVCFYNTNRMLLKNVGGWVRIYRNSSYYFYNLFVSVKSFFNIKSKNIRKGKKVEKEEGEGQSEGRKAGAAGHVKVKPVFGIAILVS